MRLLNLTTQNFKRLGTVSIDLTNGLNAVTGPNGFGKTTIMEAVMMSIGGAGQVRGKAENLKTWGETKAWSLHLTLEDSGHEYCIKSTASTATVTKDGEEVVTGRSAVNEYMAGIVGSLDTFKLLHWVGQKEAAAIAKTGGTKLQRQIEKMSGADVLDQVQQWCRQEAKTATAVAEGLNPPTEDEVSNLGLQLEALKSDDARLTDEVSQHEQTVAMLTEGKDEANRHMTGVEEGYRTYQKWLETERTIKSDLALLTERKDSVAQVIRDHDQTLNSEFVDWCEDATPILNQLSEAVAASAQEVETCKQSLRQHTEVMAEYLGKKAAFDSAVKAKHDLESKLDHYYIDPELYKSWQESRRELSDKVEVQTAWLEEARQCEQDMLSHMGAMEAEASGIDSRVRELTKSLTDLDCPTCKRPYSEHDNRSGVQEEIQNLQSKLEAMRKDYAELQTKRKQSKEDSGKLEARLSQVKNDLAKAQHQISVMDDSIAKRSEAAAALESHELPAEPVLPASDDELNRVLHNAKTQCEDATVRKQRFEWLLSKREDLLGKYDEANKAAHFRLEDLDTHHYEKPPLYSEDDVRISTEAWRKSVTNLQIETDKLINAKADLSIIINRITDYADQLERGNKLTEQSKSLLQRSDLLGSLDLYVRDRRTRFLSDIWLSICAKASEIAGQITDGIITSNGLSGKIENIRRDGTTFSCEVGGNRVQVSELSGAQEDLVGLAVKMAVAKVLSPGQSFLLMDEPTSAMDSVIGSRTMAAIAAMSGQVITVTHKEAEVASAETVIVLE